MYGIILTQCFHKTCLYYHTHLILK